MFQNFCTSAPSLPVPFLAVVESSSQGRDCLSLMDRSTKSTQPNNLGSFDKCTYISKVFSSQGRPLLAAFRQINVSTSVLFCLVFDLQEGCAVFSSPFLWPAVNTLHRAQSCCKQAALQHGCAWCLAGCAGVDRSGWGCPVSSQPVCAHPARQKIRLTQAGQQTRQSYF